MSTTDIPVPSTSPESVSFQRAQELIVLAFGVGISTDQSRAMIAAKLREWDRSLPDIVRQAFFLGFLVSREGFNGEYAGDHLAPKGLDADRGWTEQEVRAMLEASETWLKLRELAVKRLAP